jgi:hypothetical protein
MLQAIPNSLKIENCVITKDNKTVICCLNSEKESIDVNVIKDKKSKNKFKILPKLDSAKI